MPSPEIGIVSRPDERFLLANHLHERAVGALIGEHEAIAVKVDARVQPRDQVAAHDHVAFLGAPDHHLGMELVNGHFAVTHAQAES